MIIFIIIIFMVIKIAVITIIIFISIILIILFMIIMTRRRVRRRMRMRMMIIRVKDGEKSVDKSNVKNKPRSDRGVASPSADSLESSQTSSSRSGCHVPRLSEAELSRGLLFFLGLVGVCWSILFSQNIIIVIEARARRKLQTRIKTSEVNTSLF
jgi:hypothetical protein